MKKKIGILFDSSCGLSKKEAESYGFYFVPIIIEIDEKEYYSGVDIDNNFLYKNLKPGTKVRTASIKLGELQNAFDNALNNCETLIFVSLSKHLSSINSTALTLAKNYDGRVFVYDSEFITPWIYERMEELNKALKNNASLKDILKILDKQKDKMTAMIVPDNLDFLYSGGRLTRAQYLAGNLLKITPIIFVNNGSISKDNIIKTRTINRAIDKMIEYGIQQNKILMDQGFKTRLLVLNINSKDNAKIMKEKLNDLGIKDFEETRLAAEVIAHLGPNAIGLGVLIA